jgi:hypothetical protein
MTNLTLDTRSHNHCVKGLLSQTVTIKELGHSLKVLMEVTRIVRNNRERKGGRLREGGKKERKEISVQIIAAKNHDSHAPCNQYVKAEECQL